MLPNARSLRRIGSIVVALAALACTAVPAAAAPPPSNAPLPIKYEFRHNVFTCIVSVGPEHGVDVKENGKIVGRAKIGCNAHPADRGRYRVSGEARLQKKQPNGNWKAIDRADVGDFNQLKKVSKPCALGTYRVQLVWSAVRPGPSGTVLYTFRDMKLNTPELTVTSC